MPGLILPQRFNQQPQQAAQVEWGNPLARGLASYMPLTGKWYRDAVDASAWTAVATTTPLAFDVAPRGLGMRVKGATPAYVTRPIPAAITSNGAQPLTIRYRLYFRSVASTHSIMSWASIAQDGTPRYYVRISDGTLNFFYSGGYHFNVPVQAEREYIVTDTFDGITHTVYLNGVPVANSFGGWSANFSSLYLGIGFDGQTASTDFLLSDFAMWNRGLSVQEVASDAQNPWQLLKAPARRLWLATVGGVSPVSGTFAATEGGDTLAASGSLGFVPITGTLARTEGADTLAASGALGLIPLTGAFAATEASDTLAASGSVTFSGVSGTFASTEAPDTAAGAGTVTWNPITGLFAATESADRLAASGSVALPEITGTFAATEGADTLAGGNIAPVTGGGGGGGSVRDVRAFADQLERISKQTKSHKKQVRRALETEALALLPDEPAAKEIAPLLAALVAREQAPVLAAWQPVRALMPVALPHAAEAQLMALVQQWQAERAAAEWAANDEYETELLLLGAA